MLASIAKTYKKSKIPHQGCFFPGFSLIYEDRPYETFLESQAVSLDEQTDRHEPDLRSRGVPVGRVADSHFGGSFYLLGNCIRFRPGSGRCPAFLSSSFLSS